MGYDGLSVLLLEVVLYLSLLIHKSLYGGDKCGMISMYKYIIVQYT